MNTTSGNPSLDFAIRNKGKFDAIIGEFRRKHGGEAPHYLENIMFLGTGLKLSEVEKYLGALK